MRAGETEPGKNDIKPGRKSIVYRKALLYTFLPEDKYR